MHTANHKVLNANSTVRAKYSANQKIGCWAKHTLSFEELQRKIMPNSDMSRHAWTGMLSRPAGNVHQFASMIGFDINVIPN